MKGLKCTLPFPDLTTTRICPPGYLCKEILSIVTCPVSREASSSVICVLHNRSKEPSEFLIQRRVSSWGSTRNCSRAVCKTRSVEGDGTRPYILGSQNTDLFDSFSSFLDFVYLANILCPQINFQMSDPHT